jgi:4'-phosphopantetheinyl transferase superfamily protein
VIPPARIPVWAQSGGPKVWLLDARHSSLDEHGLRGWARELIDNDAAAHNSHSQRYPYALVAFHTAPVGVDIERVEQFDESFFVSICTPAERALKVDLDDLDGYAISLWSSKEALTKALGDAVAYDPRRLDSPMFWPDGRSGPWRAVSLPVPSGHSGWLCWQDASVGGGRETRRSSQCFSPDL